MVGGLNDLAFVDWPLESLLPAGRERRTTGSWWQEYWTGFADGQKELVRTYLIGVQSMLRETIHLSELQFI
ncbi:hypothetical protein CWO90_45945, partial [Bradyrhizobium sp. Leo121]